MSEKRKIKKEMRSKTKDLFPDHRFDLLIYNTEEFQKGDDLVVIDAKLHGIALIGERILFEERSKIDNISTVYLKSRIRSIDENLARSEKMSEDPRDYFLGVAGRALKEIAGIMNVKTGPLKTYSQIKKETVKVKGEVSRKGERVWLT